MVSASKMKGDLARLDQGRDFAYNSIQMIFKCDTYMQRKSVVESGEARELLVPVTSDRGLCGSINSGVMREMRSYLLDKNHKNIALFVIGEKGTAASIRPFRHILIESAQKLSHPVNFPLSMAVSQKMITLSSDMDKIVIFYNKFKSAIASEL